MTYQDTLDPLHPQSGLAQCFFVIGFIDGLSCSLLVLGAAISLFVGPLPRPFGVVLKVLIIALLVSSTIIAGASLVEMGVALFGGNRYERFTFFRSRFGGAVVYFLSLGCNLLPQCFWNPRIRKNMLALLLIAVGASLPMWLERWVLWSSR